MKILNKKFILFLSIFLCGCAPTLIKEPIILKNKENTFVVNHFEQHDPFVGLFHVTTIVLKDLMWEGKFKGDNTMYDKRKEYLRKLSFDYTKDLCPKNEKIVNHLRQTTIFEYVDDAFETLMDIGDLYQYTSSYAQKVGERYSPNAIRITTICNPSGDFSSNDLIQVIQPEDK